MPGGYVDEGERVETAAIREVEEETGVVVTLDHLLYVYSDPKRDSRQHNLAVVFTSDVTNMAVSPVGNDDAIDARFYSIEDLPKLVFDHAEIIEDFIKFVHLKQYPHPQRKLDAPKL